MTACGCKLRITLAPYRSPDFYEIDESECKYKKETISYYDPDGKISETEIY